MFKHQGKSRTKKHNLRIAIILSFVAGIVNVTGFLSFKQLTTNVTGHFALFINDVMNFEFWKGSIYFLFIFSFLLGSFISSFIIETVRKKEKQNLFVLPTVIESLILIGIAITSDLIKITYPTSIVCLLLFAMGMQNSFVTQISNAVVRTTHLTGLFTDLGIDISQLFFQNSFSQRENLKTNIKLRIAIITSFFTGGLIGGILYSTTNLKLNTLIIAGAILLFSLFYDSLRYRLLTAKRKSNPYND